MGVGEYRERMGEGIDGTKIMERDKRWRMGRTMGKGKTEGGVEEMMEEEEKEEETKKKVIVWLVF